MAKLIFDWARSNRCSFCRAALINQRVYIARDKETQGLTAALGSEEPTLYSAVNCPRCGKQHIIGEYYRPIKGAGQ